MIEPKKVFPFRKVLNGEDSAQTAFYSLTLPSDLPYFEGHFPNQPVLPGFAILDASTELVRQVLAKESIFVQSVKNAKFLDLMKPNDTFAIAVSCPLNPKLFKILWTRETDQKKVAEIDLLIE
jgi:3-hydroxymyristoyl/3-hydroxydecanoyl-(acyl carrier protein) dehydratase